MKPLASVVCLILCLKLCTNAIAQDAVPDEKRAVDEPMALKFYPLGELVNNDNTSPQSINEQMGQQGLGGGGGFFSIPATPLSHTNSTTQFGGGGGTGAWQQPQVLRPRGIRVYKSDDQHADLIQTLTDSIDSPSWEINGGNATISAVNGTLLIRQTESNHKLVSAFLKQLLDNTLGGQAVSMEIWWLPLNAEELRELSLTLATEKALTEVNNACESTGGFHATVRGRSRFTSNLNSIQKMPMIVGKVPVVGTGAVGEQLVINKVDVGILASVTPRMLETWQGEGVQIQMQTTLTTITDVSLKESSGSELDRFKLGLHTMECNTICQIDHPVVVGSLSAVGLFPQNDDQRRMTVVVLVKH